MSNTQQLEAQVIRARIGRRLTDAEHLQRKAARKAKLDPIKHCLRARDVAVRTRSKS